MVHFKFNLQAGDKYGTSIIHSSLPLLETKDQIESDLRVIVRRYAAPIIHAQLGDETHLPSSDDITDAQNDLKDIYADTEYVTNYLMKLNVIGFEGKAMNMDYILKHIDSNIMMGLQTPMGEDVKDDEVKLRRFGRHIKAIQRAIKTEFEDNVIIGLGLGNKNDKLIWGDADEREQEIEVDQLRGLVTDGLITPQKGNDLLPPEFREKLPEPDPMMMGEGTPKMGQGSTGARGANAIKDTPTDPTKKNLDDGKGGTRRRVKSDREINVK